MDIVATQDNELGLTTNEKRTKSYTVGIPKIISFDINVSVNRKNDKKMTPRKPIQNTPTPYDDPSLMKTPPSYKKTVVEPPSSGSDDVTHGANNATTHSDSIEIMDKEEKLKELPMMLQKLASLSSNEPTMKVTGFVRSPEISPRKRGNNRRTTGRMTPILGSNRVTTRTAPTSPLGSPRNSTTVSTPIVIPNEIKLDDEMIVRQLPAPRQSLNDTNNGRGPGSTAVVTDSDTLAKQLQSLYDMQQRGGDNLAHSTS